MEPIASQCRSSVLPPSHLQRNGMTSQQRFELLIAKVIVIRDMRISANSELSAIRSELGALRKATLENTNRGIQDVVGVQEEEDTTPRALFPAEASPGNGAVELTTHQFQAPYNSFYDDDL